MEYSWTFGDYPVLKKGIKRKYVETGVQKGTAAVFTV